MTIYRQKQLVTFTLFVLLVLYLWTAAGCGSNFTPKPPYDPNYLNGSEVKWNKSVVLYRIIGGNSNILFINPPGDVRVGFSYWNTALGVSKTITVRKAKDNEEADIEVRFTEEGTTFLDVGNAGQTDLTYDGSGLYLTHANVYLRSSLLPYKRVLTSSHEFGHAMGIRQHTTGFFSIMSAIVEYWHYLQPIDANTMAKLYDPNTPFPFVPTKATNVKITRVKNGSEKLEGIPLSALPDLSPEEQAKVMQPVAGDWVQ